MKQRYIDAHEYDCDAHEGRDWRDNLVDHACRNALLAGFLVASMFIGSSSGSDPLERVNSAKKPMTEAPIQQAKPVVPTLDLK